jgi:hypothetical protein
MSRFRDITVGPPWAGLNLPLHAWAADGLLAMFFFIVGNELKQECPQEPENTPLNSGRPTPIHPILFRSGRVGCVPDNRAADQAYRWWSVMPWSCAWGVHRMFVCVMV